MFLVQKQKFQVCQNETLLTKYIFILLHEDFFHIFELLFDYSHPCLLSCNGENSKTRQVAGILNTAEIRTKIDP